MCCSNTVWLHDMPNLHRLHIARNEEQEGQGIGNKATFSSEKKGWGLFFCFIGPVVSGRNPLQDRCWFPSCCLGKWERIPGRVLCVVDEFLSRELCTNHAHLCEAIVPWCLSVHISMQLMNSDIEWVNNAYIITSCFLTAAYPLIDMFASCHCSPARCCLIPMSMPS